VPQAVSAASAAAASEKLLRRIVWKDEGSCSGFPVAPSYFADASTMARGGQSVEQMKSGGTEGGASLRVFGACFSLLNKRKN
jgi:hypothetical protein